MQGSVTGYGEDYYEKHLGDQPYVPDSPDFRAFFDSVGEAVVSRFRPRTSLDVGCAMGFLVAELAKRGVDATGFDSSEYAVSQAESVREGLSERISVRSATEPIEGRFDIVSCIEVVEHLTPSDGRVAIANMCAATDTVLFSSTPADFGEPTHLNVQPAEYWASLFAEYGLYRDHSVDASFLSAWAILFRRQPAEIPSIVNTYERERALLVDERNSLREEIQRMADESADAEINGEVIQLRAALDSAQGEVARISEDIEDLKQESVRLREAKLLAVSEARSAITEAAELRSHNGELHALFIGAQAQANHAHGLGARLAELENSKSLKLGQAVTAPVRRIRGH